MKFFTYAASGLFLFSFLLLSCQKDNASSSVEYTDAPPIITSLAFTINGESFQLEDIRNSDVGMDDCDLLVQNSNNVDNNCSSWNQYYTGTQRLTVARQDDGDLPTVRLAFGGLVDLEAEVFPVPVKDAMLSLRDLGRVIIPVNDDEELGTGAIVLQSDDLAPQITITSRKGYIIEGSFSGQVLTTTGIPVDIEDGIFTARLNWN